MDKKQYIDLNQRKNTDYIAYSGSENFVCGGENIGSVMEFWQYQYSRLENQFPQIAEFLAAKALGIHKAENTGYWTAYDMTYRSKRLEIKETAYVHTWNKSRVSKVRTFSVAPSQNDYWGKGVSDGKKYSRQSDIYIFCLNINQNIKESDPLNVDCWRFYVVPTEKINQYAEKNNNPNQKTVQLSVIKRLAGEEVTFSRLKEKVDCVTDSLEK